MVKMILIAIAVSGLIASPSYAMGGRAPDKLHPKQVTSVDPKTIPVEDSLVMGNPAGSKKLYVFTDPDCPSCRGLHARLKQLEKIAPDVAIHIMLLPLPMHPSAYGKARVVRARKSGTLLDDCFAGKELPAPVGAEGKDGVDAIIHFAGSNGISRTPTLVLPDGRMVVGGMSAEALKQMLDGM